MHADKSNNDGIYVNEIIPCELRLYSDLISEIIKIMLMNIPFFSFQHLQHRKFKWPLYGFSEQAFNGISRGTHSEG